MRKRYLSALLFGALLLASAGTFTSCKDYDDDIKNLQEQINTVKTSLDELTTKVNSLGAGVTDFKYENGQLVIVTDKGTNFTVDMPECEGIVKLEIKDGVLYADGVAVGNVSGDGGSVVEVKDGVLYIDGKAQDLTVGNKVAVKDNGDGTYTLTVDGKDYILPKGLATNLTVEGWKGAYKTTRYYFTQISQYGQIYSEKAYGIKWGSAVGAVDWTGPKGKVAAGQFLVGQTTNVQVKVTPANAQLDLMDLKLVDVQGNVAPVVVTPVATATTDQGTTGSRSVSIDGTWNLSIAMDETVTADNMGSAFAASVNGEDKNKLYALQADGQIVTGYTFVIDTDVEASEAEDVKAGISSYVANNLLVNGATFATASDKLPISSSIELGYKNDYVYDYKFEIAAQDENDCEELGITLENNVLKGITNKAAGKTLHFVLTVMGVDGSVKTYDKNVIALTIADIKADAVELPATAYTLSVDANKQNDVVIDLGTTFTGLTAAEAISLVNAESTWTLEGYNSSDPETNNFVVSTSTGEFTVEYYSDAACENKVGFDDSSDNIRKIKYAKIDVTALNANATPGTHNLILTLKAKSENSPSGFDEVKKVKAPVTVSAPKFDDIFVKSAAWTDGVASLVLDENAKSDVMRLYDPKAGVETANVNVTATVNIDGTEYNPISATNNTFAINSNAVDNGNLRDIVAEVSYKVQGNENFTIKSGKFTVKFTTWFSEYSFVNYVNDAATAITVKASKPTLSAYANKNGITLVRESDKYALVGDLLSITGNKVTAANTDWSITFDGKQGAAAAANVDASGNIVFTGALATGKYTTNMILKFKSIDSGKAGADVYSTIVVPVNVDIAQ